MTPHISSPSRRKHKFASVIKARTIAMVSLALAVVIQFSTESYLYAAIHQYPPTYDSQLDGSPSTVLHRTIPVSNRYGFVSKSSLRTRRILHEPHPTIETIYRNEKSEVHSHPRVVSMFLKEDETYSSTILTPSSSSTSNGPPRIVEAMGQPCCSSDDLERTVLDFEEPFLEDCTPIINETPQARPICNSLHELDLVETSSSNGKASNDISLVSTKGSWRTVWAVDDGNNNSNDSSPVALKMLQMYRNFTHETYHAHATDAWVMDRLTSSQHVIDAHGFCGNSVMTEWATTGGRDRVKSYDLRNRERLKIARDLARGLADLQALRNTAVVDDNEDGDKDVSSSAVFSHNDINIANTVYVDGTIKWNDFNIGVFLRRSKWNETKNCGAPVRYRSDLWRSPEEIRNTTYVRLEQSDIYGFGNILYQTMTRHQPWTHKEPGGQLTIDNIAEKKRQGLLPTIPEQYKNTSKVELQAMVLATVACYHPNPDKRPSAKELADGLSVVYDRLKNKKGVKPTMLRDLLMK